MTENCINCLSPLPPLRRTLSHSAHTNPMELGPKTLFLLKIEEKKPKDSTPKRGGVLPPLKKVGFKWTGGEGSMGVPTKNSLGDAVIGQNNDFPMGQTNNSTPWGRVRKWAPKSRGM